MEGHSSASMTSLGGCCAKKGPRTFGRVAYELPKSARSSVDMVPRHRDKVFKILRRVASTADIFGSSVVNGCPLSHTPAMVAHVCSLLAHFCAKRDGACCRRLTATLQRPELSREARSRPSARTDTGYVSETGAIMRQMVWAVLLLAGCSGVCTSRYECVRRRFRSAAQRVW